jgi:hypothetical protein
MWPGGKAVRGLVAEIERERTRPNLNAAIRGYVVAYYRESVRRELDDVRR